MPLSFQILKNKEPNLKFDRDMSCRDIYLKVTRIIINALKKSDPMENRNSSAKKPERINTTKDDTNKTEA